MEYSDEFRATIAEMFRASPKNCENTLVKFKNSAGLDRWAIVGLDHTAMENAWFVYRNRFGDKPEDFLLLVYDVTKHSVPRLYSRVTPMDLSK